MTDREIRLRERIDRLIDERDAALAQVDELRAEVRARGRQIGGLKNGLRLQREREARLRAELRRRGVEIRRQRTQARRAERRVWALLRVPRTMFARDAG